MTTRAGSLIARFEDSQLEYEVIPNKDAIKLLKDTYLGGKNKDNPAARWVDTSRGDDFVRFMMPLDQIRNVDDPKNGIVDDTVNVDYAKTLIHRANDLPPLLLSRNVSVNDGGHRYYAFHHAKMKHVPVIMPKRFFDRAREKGLL